MKKILIHGFFLLVVFASPLLRAQPQGSVTVTPQGGVSLEVNKKPAPVVIEQRPVVVERPVVVTKQPVTEKVMVQEKSGCQCSMATDATAVSGIGAMLAFSALGLAGRVLRKRRF